MEVSEVVEELKSLGIPDWQAAKAARLSHQPPHICGMRHVTQSRVVLRSVTCCPDCFCCFLSQISEFSLLASQRLPWFSIDSWPRPRAVVLGYVKADAIHRTRVLSAETRIRCFFICRWAGLQSVVSRDAVTACTKLVRLGGGRDVPGWLCVETDTMPIIRQIIAFSPPSHMYRQSSQLSARECWEEILFQTCRKGMAGEVPGKT